MVIVASPRDASRPAVRAAWCPKFRESWMPRISRRRSAQERITSKVRSVEPSSTRMTSKGSPDRSRTGRSDSRNNGRASCSL